MCIRDRVVDALIECVQLIDDSLRADRFVVGERVLAVVRIEEFRQFQELSLIHISEPTRPY